MVMGMEKVVERQVEGGVARATVSGIVQTVVNCGLANSNSNSDSLTLTPSGGIDYATKCSSSGEIPVHCT